MTRRDFVAALAAAGMAAGGSALAQAENTSGTCAANNGAVYVVAAITVKDGQRDELVKHFKANVPAVHAEDGCIFYEPVIDTASGIPIQGALRPNVLVVMEKWESLAHLLEHLKAPHMDAYREKVKDLVVDTALQVFQAA